MLMKRYLFCQIALIFTILISPKLALADIGGLTKCSIQLPLISD